MSTFIRGVKNSVRNPVRTVSVVILLGVAMAFALSLLLANQAVKAKLSELKSSGATVLTVSPAGQGFGPSASGGGEPLTDEMYSKVKALGHVSDSGVTLNGGIRRTFGGDQPAMGSGDGTTSFTAPGSEIDLESPLDAGTLGRRQLGNERGTATEDVPDFKIPVQATGISGNLDSSGKNYVLTSGEWFSGASDEAVVGSALAEKNNLSVGSTFTAYDKTFKVVGIYDGGSEFSNAGLLLPLAFMQEATEQTGEVSSMVVKVDSIDNLESVKSAITNALGKDAVEVSSSAQSTDDAISSLESIQKISVAGVVIAVIAAGVIVFMIMLMIVRERKREIAVLKSIGASNLKITSQFVAEAVTLTVCSVALGVLIALASSNGLTGVLVSSNTTDTSDSSQTQTGPGGRSFRRMIGGPVAQTQTSAKDLLSDVQTSVGAGLLVQGLIAIVLIGVLGSAIPAYAISKVRPAEVMRGE